MKIAPGLAPSITRAVWLGVLAVSAWAQPSSNSPLATPPNGPRRADPTWVALADCTVHVKPGEAIEHATVVFRDGRISAVLAAQTANGPDGKPFVSPARIPMGPRVVDCKGLHVYPAFIDPYVEVDAPAPTGDDSAQHSNPRVTPHRSALAGAGLDEGSASGLRKMGFAAAAITPKGGIFRGRAALVSLAKLTDEPSAAKPGVYRDDIYQSVAMDASGGGYPDSQMGAIAVIRQTLSDAAWQAARRVNGMLTTPLNMLDWLAPSAATAKSGPQFPVRPSTMLFSADSELDLFRIEKIVGEFSCGPHFILGSGGEYRRPSSLLTPGETLFLPLTYPKAPDVGSLAKQESVELRDMMAWEQAPTNPRRLNALGVKFLLTTARLKDRGEFWSNLRTAIKYGLPEDVALEALTIRPAQALDAASMLGTVEMGKVANIAIFDGPCFGKNAEGKDSKVRGVWVDGIWHEVGTIPASFEGTWEVSIPADDRKISRSFEIDRDNGITVYRDDKNVKATKVDAGTGRLSFSFDHDSLDGQEGLCSMMALVSDAAGTAKADATMTGIGVTGTGKRFEWIAKRKPRSLTGLWPIVFDAPGHPGPILVLSKTNALTFRNAVTRDPAAAPDAKPQNAVATDFTYDGTSFSYKQDTAPVGGVVTVDGTVDWTRVPPTMTGAVHAGERAFSWTSSRRDGNPFVGTWRVTSHDGTAAAVPAKDDKDPDGFTLTITADSVTLTNKAKPASPVVVKAKDVKFTGLVGGEESPWIELAFTHDMGPLGGEGTSSDRIKISLGKTQDADTISGESTLSAGGKHQYEAARVVDDKEKDDAAPTDVPEKLPTPFGPFGFDELPEQAANLIISNVKIYTCGKAGIIEKGFVYVRAGKIVMVGSGDPSVAVPQGEKSTYLDAKGRCLTPGIIDCHSHTGISGGVNESGQAVTSECRIEDVTNPDAIGWYQQLAGGVTAVNNLHGSANAIGGQSQTNKLRWGCASPEDMHFDGAMPGIKFALGENPRRANGGDGARYPTTRMGVEMLIRDRFTAADEYRHSRGSPEFRRDLELEPLAEILDGKRLVHSHSYRQDEMLMLAMVAKDFKFRIGTYQHALEGYKVADYVRDWSGGASGFSDWWAYKVEVQDAIPAAFPIMAEQGVVVSFNSDSNELARHLNTEAAKAVKYGGVSEEEALKYVTLNPAKQLHIDARVGSIEEGKDADLALWSGSPLSAFSRCEATYVDGRCLFSIDQDKAMRERVQKERLRLIQKLMNDGKKKPEAGGSKDDGAKPAGGDDAPRDGRRRRGPRPPQLESEELLRQYYIELSNYGSIQEQGVCGCGLIHAQMR